MTDGAEQDRISATEEKEREDAARYRLRKQAQVIGRAADRSSASGRKSCSRCGWKSCSADESVAILENTVLVLILVLFLLIASEAVLERAQPQGLSAWQHWFFAWADLAVCSVFLFEFTLKLALAPHRMSYFLRHMLIDLLASLPFGFVAHQIELERMGDLARQDRRLGSVLASGADCTGGRRVSVSAGGACRSSGSRG